MNALEERSQPANVRIASDLIRAAAVAQAHPETQVDDLHDLVDVPFETLQVATPAAPVALSVIAPSALPAAAVETAQPAALPTSELFGSFLLGQDEFALSAYGIREVVNFPEKLTPIPLSPPYLEGVFTLRGNVIPVLNLGRIFDPTAGRAEPNQKIAIVDHEQVQVGLLFHDTGEILRVRPEQRSSLSYRDPATHGVVSGTIRLDDGKRLLQILDPQALVHIENLPQVQALKSTGRTIEKNQFHLQTERRQCVAFHAGGIAFAFEMSAIREIIDVPELKASVLNSKLCVGRINLRGNAVAVVDFAELLKLGDAPKAAGGERRIIIARIGEASVGLLVDSVDNIFSFFPGDVLPIPLLSKSRAGMFGGCISKDGLGDILFLNHLEMFSRDEVVSITRGHADLYQDEAEKERKSGDRAHAANARQVYITFALENSYALEIKQIREIIDYPADMLKPPSAPAFVQGILNLRRQMITIINLRNLYQMPDHADQAATKILVFERGDERYGLMVDTVENIVTVTDSDRIPAPRMMRNNASTSLRNEMQEVIEMADGQGGRKTLSVFELDVFLERLSREVAAA